jgi:hypothetical protein
LGSREFRGSICIDDFAICVIMSAQLSALQVMGPAPLTLLPDGTSFSVIYAQPFKDYWYMFIAAAVLYLPTIVALRAFMRDRKPYSLKPLLVLWNGGLAALSVAMIVACKIVF